MKIQVQFWDTYTPRKGQGCTQVEEDITARIDENGTEDDLAHIAEQLAKNTIKQKAMKVAEEHNKSLAIVVNYSLRYTSGNQTEANYNASAEVYVDGKPLTEQTTPSRQSSRTRL